MSSPHHCNRCGKLAKVGTPGTVRVPYNGNMLQLKVESPLCSNCIGELIKPFGEVTGKTIGSGSTGPHTVTSFEVTGPAAGYNSDPVGMTGNTGALRGRMRKVMSAGRRSKKWLGKRR